MYMIMKAEVRKDGEWQSVGRVFKSFIQDGLYTNRVYDERNSVLFEALGCAETGKHKYKTIPIIKHYDGFIAYLEDLLKYDWDQTVSKVGIISEFQYKRWVRYGTMPVNKHRCVFNKSAQIVDASEMDAIFTGKEQRTAPKYYVRFEYDTMPMRKLCENFYNYCLPSLIRLVPSDGTTHDVRVVYQFVQY